MKIDAYTHFFPRRYLDAVLALAPDREAIKRWLTIPALHDLDARLRVVDAFDGYQQVLAPSLPPIEFFAGPGESPELARIANDGLAELCARYPERFPAFVAALPMNDPDAAVAEIDRAIGRLGARGVQVCSHVDGRPLDEPAFLPVFERMAAHDLPVWLHPARGPNFPDYPSERRSKYEIWWTFGWPYETSAAMARLVFSGLFDRLPGLKVITHHMGAMVPYFEGRVGSGWDQLGTRTADADRDLLPPAPLRRRPLDYFRMFYADTALFGARAATRCGLEFFGADRCLFGTDCPFDPEGGPMYVRDTIAALDGLGLSAGDRARIYAGNARRLLRLDR